MKSPSATKKGPGRYHYPGIAIVAKYLAAGGKQKYHSIANFRKVTGK